MKCSQYSYKAMLGLSPLWQPIASKKSANMTDSPLSADLIWTTKQNKTKQKQTDHHGYIGYWAAPVK